MILNPPALPPARGARDHEAPGGRPTRRQRKPGNGVRGTKVRGVPSRPAGRPSLIPGELHGLPPGRAGASPPGDPPLSKGGGSAPHPSHPWPARLGSLSFPAPGGGRGAGRVTRTPPFPPPGGDPELLTLRSDDPGFLSKHVHWAARRRLAWTGNLSSWAVAGRGMQPRPDGAVVRGAWAQRPGIHWSRLRGQFGRTAPAFQGGSPSRCRRILFASRTLHLITARELDGGSTRGPKERGRRPFAVAHGWARRVHHRPFGTCQSTLHGRDRGWTSPYPLHRLRSLRWGQRTLVGGLGGTGTAGGGSGMFMR